MTDNSSIINDYADRAGTDQPRRRGIPDAWHRYSRRSRDGDTVTPVFAEDRSLYSYGHHFELARIMPSPSGDPRGWWLVNSDTYSVSTSNHQRITRSALGFSHLPMILLPFSALDAAGIDLETIRSVDILPDRYDYVAHTGPECDMPRFQDAGEIRRNVFHGDGTATWHVAVHRMGESVFTASYVERGKGYADYSRAAFLSSFDAQESRRRGYFLCQLPDVPVSTVAEAYDALKPAEVKHYEASGGTVTRQGDIFALPMPHLTTRDLDGPTLHSGRLLGTSHIATEVRVVRAIGSDPVVTYARGWLRHRPERSWNRPQHSPRKMEDGRTWHRIVKNTVAEGRSWQVSGGVD
jgi:hypothetical protein